jgi:uncharacterized protein (UPF0548 family)
VIRLFRPDERTIAAALARGADGPLSYDDVGMTRRPRAKGWPVNRIRTALGRGPEVWRRAVAALARWEQYQTSWTALHPTAPALTPGTNFAALGKHYGFWSVNCCRVVYGPDADARETGAFAYAIGTLEDHSESGEERFLIEREDDETVWFELVAYARAKHPLGKLVPPAVTHVQRKFARDAAAAMMRAVG